MSYDQTRRKSGTRRRARHGRHAIRHDERFIHDRRSCAKRSRSAAWTPKVCRTCSATKALDNDAKNPAPADAGDDADKPAADDAVDVGDAKPDSAAAMDDDAVSLGGDDKDDPYDAPEYASTEQQAEARLADSIAPDVRRMAPATAIAARAASAVPRVRRPRVSSSPIARTQRVPLPRTARSCSAPSAASAATASRPAPSASQTQRFPKGGCPICGDVSHRMFCVPRRKIDPDLVCPICKKKGHERRNCPDKPPRITPRRGASSAANATSA